jgi:hypothetical protein
MGLSDDARCDKSWLVNGTVALKGVVAAGSWFAGTSEASLGNSVFEDVSVGCELEE